MYNDAYSIDVEYWTENDTQVDEDFSLQNVSKTTIEEPCEASDEDLNHDQKRFIWWIIAFTCLFETLHKVSLRGIAFLLKFLHVMLLCLVHLLLQQLPASSPQHYI